MCMMSVINAEAVRPASVASTARSGHPSTPGPPFEPFRVDIGDGYDREGRPDTLWRRDVTGFVALSVS